MKTYPDHAPAKIIKSGAAKGSIVNYWPPKYPLSRAAQKRMADERRSRGELRKREMLVLADEIRAGRRWLRNCDMTQVLIALRECQPK